MGALLLKKQDELLVSATEREHLIIVSKTVKVQLCFSQKCDWLMAEVNNDDSLRCTSPSFCRLVHPSAWTVTPTCYDVSLRSHNS